MNAKPTVSKTTPTYLISQVTKVKPMTANIGMKNPKELNIFLTMVFEILKSITNLSPITPDTIIKSQNTRYGTADKAPF